MWFGVHKAREKNTVTTSHHIMHNRQQFIIRDISFTAEVDLQYSIAKHKITKVYIQEH